MIVNARNNNFRLEIPKKFFFDSVIDKYDFYLKRMPTPYSDIASIINASIQGVSFPAAVGPVIDQTLFDDPIKWKGRGNLNRWITKEFSITFKLYEGYINYWIMFEQLQAYYDYNQRIAFMEDFVLQFLDNTGFELIAFKFEKTIFTGISNLDLSFSSNVPNFQTFTCDFVYNYAHIIKRLD